MYVLDTDTVSFVPPRESRNRPSSFAKPRTETSLFPKLLLKSCCANRSQTFGIIKARGRSASVLAYSELSKLVKEIAKFQILPYDERAETLFRSWGASVKLIGSQDCRIAACAMVNGFRVVTRNQKDFARLSVPFEDWSAKRAVKLQMAFPYPSVLTEGNKRSTSIPWSL